MPVFYETSIALSKSERLAIRLVAESRGQKVEREHIEDGWTLTQVWPYRSLDDLFMFLEADPFSDDHRSCFQRVMREAEKHLAAKGT